MSPAAGAGAGSTKVPVDVDGHRLMLSNLDKPLYPDGTTKGQVLSFYTQVAPALLPHLAGRPLTLKRYPDGALGPSFYEKNAPRGTPEWVRRVRLPAPGSTKQRETIDYVVVDRLATLVWVANLASLELHTPQWRVGDEGEAQPPDQLVVDLDPGPPATVRECAQVALLLRPLLEEHAGEVFAKTSGSKGMQLATRWDAARLGETSDFAKALAERLEREHPALVVSRMTKALRPGKVLVDWSQNSRAKTTVSVWSLRARERPTVSTPVGWDEVEACAAGDDPLVFDLHEAAARLARDGDGWAGLLPG